MGHAGWQVMPFLLVLPPGQPEDYSDGTDLEGTFSPGWQQLCQPWWWRMLDVVDGQS